MNSKSRAFGYGHPPCGDNKKRTVTRVYLQGQKIFSPLEIIKILEERINPYSDGFLPSRKFDLDVRDKALVSLVAISACRISEALTVRKSQVDFSRLDFLLIRNFRVFKRKALKKVDPKTGEIVRIPKRKFIQELPLTMNESARLFPFTRFFLNHANHIKDKDPIFSIGIRRARQIITGLHPDIFPHFIRASMLTYYLNLLKNAFLVSTMFGIEKADTLKIYYGGAWEDASEALSA